MDYMIVLTTTEQQSQAAKIAEEAIRQRLAVCVQIVGSLTSVYRWQGKVEHAQEFRCELKTRTIHVERLRSMIREHHPYELPEIVAIPFSHLSEEYQRWMDSELES